MLRHFFFRVHSRVSRAQSDFKFISASRRNQHASGVRSPDPEIAAPFFLSGSFRVFRGRNRILSSFRRAAETITPAARAPQRLRPTRPPLQQNASTSP
jgi:hypothetical protein